MFLFIRVLDMDAVQEPSVIRGIHCQIGGRPRCSCCYLGETLSPAIREGLYYTHVLVTPWASPVNNQVVRGRETKRRYFLWHPTTFTEQRQRAVFHFRHPGFRPSASQPALQSCGRRSCCSIQFSQQVATRAISALVRDGRITMDMGKRDW